jgi:4-hydroxy-tetrahydrodipicolinate reductase
MGQAIMREIAAAEDLELAGLCVRQGGVAAATDALLATGCSPDTPVSSSTGDMCHQADVAIDFSLPEANASVIAAAVSAKIPLVCGVTGLDTAALSALRTASLSVPILYDRNMSVGVAVMHKLVRQAAAAFGDAFAASVSETHHRNKIDAPSGTALKLGEAVASGRGQDFESVYHFDPDRLLPAPLGSDIVFHASREGDNPGEHSVRFTSDTESLELAHKVNTRQVFAQGALRAARWLSNRGNGLYSVSDTLP